MEQVHALLQPPQVLGTRDDFLARIAAFLETDAAQQIPVGRLQHEVILCRRDDHRNAGADAEPAPILRRGLGSRRPRACSASTPRFRRAPRSRCGRRATRPQSRIAPIRTRPGSGAWPSAARTASPAAAPATPISACDAERSSTDTLERSTYIASRLRSVSARSAETSARNDDSPSRQISSVASIRPLGELWLESWSTPVGRSLRSFDNCPCRNAFRVGPGKGQKAEGRVRAKRRGGLVHGGGRDGRFAGTREHGRRLGAGPEGRKPSRLP